MLEAAFWGLIGGVALLLGALITFRLSLKERTIGLIMAFGAGVLISAVAYELVGDALISSRNGVVVGLGLAVGALTFFAGDEYISRKGGGDRKDAAGDQASGNGSAIALGTVLDGIPESIVIGVSLIGGQGVSVPMVVAVFVSNLPDAIASTTGLLQGGMTRGRILGFWGILAVVCAAAAALGYGVVAALPIAVTAFVQSFAAGALLTMLGDTMIPEGYEAAGRWAGIALVLGFALSFGLSAVEALAA
jgi:zinc transporter, ZIP family